MPTFSTIRPKSNGFSNAYSDDRTILVGIRRRDKTMPFARKVSNSLTSFVSSVFCGVRILDSQSGYRLIPTAILKNHHVVILPL